MAHSISLTAPGLHRVPNERMSACILGASFDTGNMGVSVLAAGALQCAHRTYPHATLYQCDYAYAPKATTFCCDEQQILVELLNIRFSKHLYLGNNIALLVGIAALSRLFAVFGLRQAIIDTNSHLKRLSSIELFLSLNGGDSFSDIYGLRRLLYVSLPQILVLLLGRPLVLLPQTIGPFKTAAAKRIAHMILSKSTAVFTRDRASQQSVTALTGGESSTCCSRICYDLGFDVDPMPPDIPRIEGFDHDWVSGDVVGINVSGLLMIGGYDKSNKFGLRADYPALCHQLIKMFITQKRTRVLLIPHVFGSSAESDLSACLALFGELRGEYPGMLGCVTAPHTYAEIKAIIGGCTFMVGARMHACIGALSQCVPAVSLAYSDKFHGVMETIGIQQLVADPRSADIPQLVAEIDTLFDSRAQLRDALVSKMPEVKRTIRAVLNDV